MTKDVLFGREFQLNAQLGTLLFYIVQDKRRHARETPLVPADTVPCSVLPTTTIGNPLDEKVFHGRWKLDTESKCAFFALYTIPGVKSIIPHSTHSTQKHVSVCLLGVTLGET